MPRQFIAIIYILLITLGFLALTSGSNSRDIAFANSYINKEIEPIKGIQSAPAWPTWAFGGGIRKSIAFYSVTNDESWILQNY